MQNPFEAGDIVLTKLKGKEIQAAVNKISTHLPGSIREILPHFRREWSRRAAPEALLGQSRTTSSYFRLDDCADILKMLAPARNFLFLFSHMKPDPSNETAGAIIGKKSVENADQCSRVAGVSQMPDPEVQGRGTVRKLVQDPYCHAFVFADLPDDGSNVAITCPVSGHTFYASASERL